MRSPAGPRLPAPVIEVLDGITDVQAALVEPATVTFHAVRRVAMELGSVVVVVGAGPIGLLTAQHARNAADWQMRELTVIGSPAYNHEDFIGAMRVIAEGRIDVDALHTGTYGLAELKDLLEELDSGTSQHTKVLVQPSR